MIKERFIMVKTTEPTEKTNTTITDRTDATDNNSKPKTSTAKKSAINITRKQGIAGLLVVAIIVVGFIAGAHYEKARQTSANSSRTSLRNSRSGGFGGPEGLNDNTGGGKGRMSARGGMRNGVFGQVTAVSSTSISVKNTRSNSDSTLSINDATKVTNNGQTASVSDVKVGDTVIIRTSATDTKTATQINLNPQMRGPGGGPMGGGTTQSQTDPQIPSQTN
jgi:hypothetical protein